MIQAIIDVAILHLSVSLLERMQHIYKTYAAWTDTAVRSIIVVIVIDFNIQPPKTALSQLFLACVPVGLDQRKPKKAIELGTVRHANMNKVVVMVEILWNVAKFSLLNDSDKDSRGEEASAKEV